MFYFPHLALTAAVFTIPTHMLKNSHAAKTEIKQQLPIAKGGKIIICVQEATNAKLMAHQTVVTVITIVASPSTKHVYTHILFFYSPVNSLFVKSQSSVFDAFVDAVKVK